jgi:hypothetical protein
MKKYDSNYWAKPDYYENKVAKKAYLHVQFQSVISQ